MKKVLTVVFCALLICILAVPSLAVTKADLLAEASKSPVYKYVKVAVENAAKSVTITEEQAEKLLPIVKKGVAALGKSHGSTVALPGTAEMVYSQEEVDFAFQCIDEICEIMNWTYTVTPVANARHEGDIIITVYEHGKMIFSYDGDVVADTSAASYSSPALLAAGCAVLVAGAAAAVVARKKLSQAQ